MPTRIDVLGRGIAFPLVGRAGERAWAWVEGEDAVAQSLRTLLHTEPGERIGRPGYGCGLRRFLFSPNTVATRALIQETVTAAVEAHEPRALLGDVTVRSDEGDSTRLWIELRYRLAQETGPRSLVFPFYLDDRSA